MRKNVDPSKLPLTFSVDTTRLGTVKVLLSFSGKMVSLNFVLKDKQVSALAKEMAGEIQNSLKARGYTVKSVTFGIQGTEIEQGNGSIKRTENVDIVG